VRLTSTRILPADSFNPLPQARQPIEGLEGSDMAMPSWAFYPLPSLRSAVSHRRVYTDSYESRKIQEYRGGMAATEIHVSVRLAHYRVSVSLIELGRDDDEKEGIAWSSFRHTLLDI